MTAPNPAGTPGEKKRYRWKLNLLGPGTVLCAAVGILFLAGLVLHLCGLSVPAVWMWGMAALIFVVLLILLGVEQHQDRQLYLDAKREDPAIK